MHNSLQLYRTTYFQEVAKLVDKADIQFLVITHFLSDRPEWLSALEAIAPLSLIIAIPYSIDSPTLKTLSTKYPTLSPSLNELMNADYLFEKVMQHINKDKPLIILEIGGYCASIIHRLKDALGEKLIGVIEDTETGHRQYKKAPALPCPVISVARSSLKETEDFLVGSSCLFSTERLMRSAGFLLECKQVLILGFGKVGRGLSHALQRKGCSVSVYDTKAIRRILALSEGFHVPNKYEAIPQADLIFGATGNYSLEKKDFDYLKKGALLVSCSSKQIEFDLDYLNAHYHRDVVLGNYAKYAEGNHHFYLLSEGTPVNFQDGAVIGPILALVQAEMILGIKHLLELNSTGNTGIFEVCEKNRNVLAEKWIDHFSDKDGGYLNG